jgi:hypothetical protein
MMALEARQWSRFSPLDTASERSSHFEARPVVSSKRQGKLNQRVMASATTLLSRAIDPALADMASELRQGCSPSLYPGIPMPYGYHPSRIAGQLFTVLFELMMIGHIAHIIQFRRWTSVLFGLGTLSESCLLTVPVPSLEDLGLSQTADHDNLIRSGVVRLDRTRLVIWLPIQP